MQFIRKILSKLSNSPILTTPPLRPLLWEDDIARHNNSNAPFMNVMSPAEIELSEYQKSYLWKVLNLSDEAFLRYRDADTLPMPTTSDREGYNRGADRDYFVGGLIDFLYVQEVATQYDLKPQSYLDFGCASGRVLRQFALHSKIPDLWGADINGRHIKFIQEHLPQSIKAIHNSAIPYFPVADDRIDLVTAFSVFTHIDTFESAWLAEIYRVMTPGALCYLTIHNDDTWNNLWCEQEKEFLYARLKYADNNIEKHRDQPIPAGRTSFRDTQIGPYRAQTFHSNDYIYANWGRFFDILEIRPFAHGRNQAVVVARKNRKARG